MKIKLIIYESDFEDSINKDLSEHPNWELKTFHIGENGKLYVMYEVNNRL